MPKYRKKPVVVEAEQWFKIGDNEKVVPFDGQVIQNRICEACGKDIYVHGTILTLEGWHIVCPGDYIVTGIAGERYPVKPEIFKATYEPVEEEEG